MIGFVADIRGGAAGNWPGPRSASLSAAVAMSPMGLVGRFMHLMLRRPTGLQQRPDVVGSQNPFVPIRTLESVLGGQRISVDPDCRGFSAASREADYVRGRERHRTDHNHCGTLLLAVAAASVASAAHDIAPRLGSPQ